MEKERSLEDILTRTFLDYSAFILQRRALGDVRDGFKFTARQIIHAQAREKLDFKHPFKKSQKSVAAATSFSYVHGGNSAYGQIIRMGRPLVQRYALEEITGNGGTPTGKDTYAAERYTEARLSGLSAEILKYIDMEALPPEDWQNTYDDEGQFPTCFPSVGFYNLCNGSIGSIGVGLVSSIPQFNLKEMNEAICRLIDNPEEEIELYPDFASGGILLNPATTLESLAVGEGKSALIRGKIKKYPKERYLEILEVPYGVYTDTICLELEKALAEDDSIFDTFKDLSRSSVQIRIYADDLDKLEEWLYRNTSVQRHFTIKMTMLDNGKTPKLFGIKDALLAHIEHAKKVYRNQYLYQLNQLELREEILRGIIKAHSILDQVIRTVKESRGRANVVVNLMGDYQFTKRQAEAIADFKTYRWSSLDIVTLEEELDTNLLSQLRIQNLFLDEIEFNKELKQIYAEIAAKFGDSRRTEINTLENWESGKDGTQPTKDFWVIDAEDGFLITYADEIGNKIIGTRVSPDEELIFISNKLRGFLKKGSDLTLGETAKNEIVKCLKDEYIIAIMKKSDAAQFEYCYIEESGKKPYYLHQSFILTGSTARGKKISSGNHDVISIELAKQRLD